MEHKHCKKESHNASLGELMSSFVVPLSTKKHIGELKSKRIHEGQVLTLVHNVEHHGGSMSSMTAA